MESLLLKPTEVAQVLGLGRTKVFEMVARGELPVVRIGRSVRVPRTALADWIAARTTSPVADPTLTAALDDGRGWSRVRPRSG